MLNVNSNRLDSCDILTVASISILHGYASIGDFLGLEQHYGLHLPPVLDVASILLLILGFWALCKFVNRVAFGPPNR